jgi:hypothetical protein
MPEMFLPYTRLINDVAAFFAKTTVDPKSLLTSLQREVWAGIVAGEPVLPVIATGSRFRNASGGSETIGSAKHSVTKSF